MKLRSYDAQNCLEALDQMRDLLRFDNPSSAEPTFCRNTVAFGGDFRQILPVIPKCRQDIVFAAINSSYLWNSCKVLRLTKNLRLNKTNHALDIKQLEDFAN